MSNDDVVPNKNKLSGMDTLLTLSGTEYVEVVKLMPDGSFKNYRTLASKLRVGKTAYDIAVQEGFVGTEAEWLVTLVGESAYKTAVRLGQFVGTEAQWVQSFSAIYSRDPASDGKALVADVNGVGAWKQLTGTDVGLAKATGAELIAGADDVKFATAASLLALLNDIGFTKDGNGDWKLAAGVVTP
ncbi:hypothetical protein D3C85_914100 [compost metagenome]